VWLTWGPDGALWFGETVSGGQGIARFDPATGAVAHYAVPGPPDSVGPLVVGPDPMIVGHDGALWAATSEAGAASMVLVRITVAGAAQAVPLTGVAGGEAYAYNPASGPDGHVWMLMGHGSQASTGVCDLVRDNLS
jgi:streptogramin lyase